MQVTQNLCILGATGSIGCNTLNVVANHTDKFNVFALTGNAQISKLAEQIIQFQPSFAVVPTERAAKALKELLNSQANSTEILFGKQALCDIASHEDVTTVMSAIVGAAGLMPTLAAVKSGKRVLLANKESLVMSGELFINAVSEHGAVLIPIDSEHNAIFQCLPHDFTYADKASSGISHLLLTASGGPFRTLPLNEFASVTPAQACAHPNWSMGQKISIDSASMMNKGLEFIEAKWLFGLNEDDIKVVIHPQSTIHSMVQYVDGSVLAQMGNPDMRTPIAHGLSYPERMTSGVQPLDFSALHNFSFEEPCSERFPNLYLAMQASRDGQSATTALNAANEQAVEAFLQNKINFLQINHVNNEVLDKMPIQNLSSLEGILAHDKHSRDIANAVIQNLC